MSGDSSGARETPKNSILIDGIGKIIEVYIRNRQIVLNTPHRRGNNTKCTPRLIVQIHNQYWMVRMRKRDVIDNKHEGTDKVLQVFWNACGQLFYGESVEIRVADKVHIGAKPADRFSNT